MLRSPWRWPWRWSGLTVAAGNVDPPHTAGTGRARGHSACTARCRWGHGGLPCRWAETTPASDRCRLDWRSSSVEGTEALSEERLMMIVKNRHQWVIVVSLDLIEEHWAQILQIKSNSLTCQHLMKTRQHLMKTRGQSWPLTSASRVAVGSQDFSSRVIWVFSTLTRPIHTTIHSSRVWRNPFIIRVGLIHFKDKHKYVCRNRSN